MAKDRDWVGLRIERDLYIRLSATKLKERLATVSDALRHELDNKE